MNKKEAYNILALLQANYPDSLRGMTKDAVQVKVNLWADIFAEEPFELVAAAAKAFMATDTNGFMPAVGQIKEQIRRLRNPDELTEQEAWNLISKALGNGIYGSTEEFAKLPPAVQKLVGKPRRASGMGSDGHDHSAIYCRFQLPTQLSGYGSPRERPVQTAGLC